MNRRFGRNIDAFEDIKQAIAIAHKTGETWWLSELLRTEAQLAIALDRPASEAQATLREARRVATLQRARSIVLRIDEELQHC